MNKIKLTILLLVTTFILVFTSCGNMVSEMEDLTIDLTALSSSKGFGDETVKIWLVVHDTNQFYNLGDDAEQELGLDAEGRKTATLSNIYVGPVYDIYITLGTENVNGFFTAEKYAQGTVSAGGTAKLAANEVKVSLYDDLTGKAVNGVAYVGSEIYTTTSTKLYHQDASDYLTDFDEESAPGGFTFNSVAEGMNDTAVISSYHASGEGFITFNGTAYDATFADDLSTELEGAEINILKSDVFWDTGDAIDVNDDLEFIVGYTKAGLVLSLEKNANTREWIPLDLSTMMPDGIEFAGQLVKGMTVVKRYTGSEVNALWVFMITSGGNNRIVIPLKTEGFDLGPDDQAGQLTELFENFQKANPELISNDEGDDIAILNIDTADDETIYIGTNNGLYTASATAKLSDMNPEIVTATEGQRIVLLSSTTEYTACVTPLSLFIVNNASGKIAAVPFNAGLPARDFLSDGGLTGLTWNGDTLYIAGNYGLTSLDVSGLTYTAAE